jgi:hypothetical protein
MNTDNQTLEKKHEKVYNIIVNGKARQTEEKFLSYDDIVRIAFPDGPFDIIYTVAYVKVHGHDDTLAPGQKTNVQEGMEFSVRKTNRS